MDLEAVGAGTASPVQVFPSWWIMARRRAGGDGPGFPSVDHWCAVFSSGGDFGDGIAEDGFEGLSSDPGSGLKVTPAFPLDGVAWVVSTNTVSCAGGGWSLMQSSARAIALRHEESPRVPSGRSGRSSAFSEIVLLTSAPVAQSRPPHGFHHDSSSEGCITRNWSDVARYSSSAVIRTRLAASRRPRPRPDVPTVRRLRESGTAPPPGRR